MRRPEVREVRCRTLLRRLDFGGGLGYTANFYKGCTHGCVYCYAPSLVHDERSWGAFVDAKVNAPTTLRREIRDAQKAPVFLSSASDPYQPLEARYRLTRRCLEELHAFGFPVVILTRSPLVLRDIDVLKKMEWVRAGCSISTACGRFYEPGVPSLEKRLETLRAWRRWDRDLGIVSPDRPRSDERGGRGAAVEAARCRGRDGQPRAAPFPGIRRLQEDVRAIDWPRCADGAGGGRGDPRRGEEGGVQSGIQGGSGFVQLGGLTEAARA